MEHIYFMLIIIVSSKYDRPKFLTGFNEDIETTSSKDDIEAYFI
jgi:hypothetical protein